MKTCSYESCTYPVFGKGYCKSHQYLRTDKKLKVPKVKVKREKLTPLSTLLKYTQDICNKYVRLRDAGKPCVSCGGYHELQAGHYIAVGQNSYLRFHEFNLWGQCGGCNGPKHGNQLRYRIELRKRIGDFELERLERDWIENPSKKWSREELNEKAVYFLGKIDALDPYYLENIRSKEKKTPFDKWLLNLNF